MNTQKRVQSFSAEIPQVLELMIRSIYVNSEIFIRELISNSSDACDKRKLLSLQSGDGAEQDFLPKIRVMLHKKEEAIYFLDNGIGMDDNDFVQYLGSIASSGTRKFIEQCKENKTKISDLIGQFGVGFYSSFIVANSVTVYSKKIGQDKTYVWNSDGKSDYTIEEASEKDALADYGTMIKLSISKEHADFLDAFRIKHVIKTYSDHILFPIEFVDDEAPDNVETVNLASAIWLKSPSEMTEEKYTEFYHHICHMPDQPWITMHNNVEGSLTYTNLLFIPTMKPFDLFRPNGTSRVKLYVKRVFITDENVNLIPSFLRFLAGVIDSEDLPLNISRETLQNNFTISKIKKSIVKKVLSTLQKKSEEDKESFDRFWSNFGEVLKEGLCEAYFEEKELLLDICRFYSIKSPDKLISLADYVRDMAEGQEEIYYISGNNKVNLSNHPQLQGFKQRDIDVLLLNDPVDDFWLTVVTQYKNYSLKAVNHSSIDLNKIKALEEIVQNDEDTSNGEKVIQYMKEVLKDKVQDVKISTTLLDNPVCLVIPEGAMNIRMEKMLIEQKHLNKPSSKILEINLKHKILEQLVKDIDANDHKAENIVKTLFYEACILEGESVDNPYEFVSLLNQFISKA